MTQRKPPGVSIPDWVERQIQSAEERGAFKNLPGAGKPIPGIDRPHGELDWVASYLRRENVDIASVLPPALALAKEVEDLPARLHCERCETNVRQLVDDLNERIIAAQRLPHDGPPFRVRTVNVNDALDEWKRSVRPPV